MKNLNIEQFNKLTLNSTLLAEDEFGKKVLELTDHSILKLFRVKRFISQATIYSPALRFARNEKKLHQLNIPTISVINLYTIKSIKRTAVHYHQLEGIMVREHLKNTFDNDIFLTKLGAFIANLHNNGVFFRSAHFGNIIYTPDGKFGLIDISDMSISRSSLGFFKRFRNLKHIFRISEDIEHIQYSQAIEIGYLNNYKIQIPFLNRLFEKRFIQICQKLKQHTN